MRKLVISACFVTASLAGAHFAAAENFAPVIRAAHHRAGCAAPSCDCAAPPTCAAAPACGAADACGACSQCDACGGKGCGHCGGLFGHGGCHNGHCGRNAYDRSASFHCGCNGSYKFPVPPLSTYHWPGMYSHQLMTDYHSPWRFPPIKPYVDEVPLVDMGADAAPGELRRASVNYSIYDARQPVGEIEPMSQKMLRYAQ